MSTLPFSKPVSPPRVPELRECLERLGCRFDSIETMPFSPGDVTAGTENELQVAVYGGRDEVDLPRRILESRFYANVEKRSRVGETPRRVLTRLERFLDDNPTGVWENSWVRFPARMLGSEAWSQLQADLHPGGASPRGDLEQFFLEAGGEQLLRVPISYLLQLAATVYHDEDAQFELLKLLSQRPAGEIDPAIVRHWMAALTRRGHAGGQAMLAELFWHGDGVEKDPVTALALSALALENTPRRDRVWIEDIYQKIYCGTSAEVRAEAQKIGVEALISDDYLEVEARIAALQPE
ncbi:MAG: hypothetical protein HC897_08400, partial [Thermoanaerobaculia bacterium]|nr:hypothetical protein [Thermoanaerobaculia bacterium]